MTPKQALLPAAATLSLPDRSAAVAARVRAYIAVCTDYFAAAVAYEQLSGLSNAELARRGLSRATLAHDVCVAFDRGGRA